MQEIDFLGNYLGHGTTFAGCVYGKDGVAPTIMSRDYKGPNNVLEVEHVMIDSEGGVH